MSHLMGFIIPGHLVETFLEGELLASCPWGGGGQGGQRTPTILLANKQLCLVT